MRIIRDNQKATLMFVPVEVAEEQILTHIAAILKPEDKLSYSGRERDSDDERFCTVRLHAGGRKEVRSENSGNLTMCRTVHVDSVELILKGTTEEDKNEVSSIRNMCYFGSSGLIFIGEVEMDGKKAIVTTGLRCKHCGAGMIQYSDCEWKTCDACAAKCEHNYVHGAIHGGGTDIGVGEFCNKCGRCKPKLEGEQEKSVIEHHLDAEHEGVVDAIFYYDSSGIPR